MFKLRGAPAQQLLKGDFADRMLNPADSKECSLAQAQRKVQTWGKLGQFTVFTAGAYDLLGINHIQGLVQCRMLGAMSKLGIETITTKEHYRATHQLAASDSIRLLVTMDTNRALEEGKSRRADKGNAPKPTLDWKTRASMLAIQSMPQPDYAGRINLVDYITRHGPGCCDTCIPGTCANEDNARMAVDLQADMVVVNTGSTQTIADLSKYKMDGQLPTTELVTIDERVGAFSDPILGSIVSTTSIINRIRS